jgi:subtilisin family serine protease
VATGSTVVVSAGNDADNALFYSPANCAGVITVHANTWFGSYAPYSNYGMPPIDISAPGGDDSYVYAGPLGTHPYDAVLSLVGAGATVATGYEYYYKAGTSMAAPHVSGVASLLLSVNDELTPGQVEMILELSAWPFPFAPSSQCNTSRCGAGILDAATALAATPEREGLHFYPITPCRIVDTRGGLGPIPANDYRTFYGDGLCGVPLGAKAIATIITVANSTGAGYLQIWPPDRPFPATSAINFAVGVNRANNAFIRLSSVGSFSVYRSPGVGATHFIVDVNGYFQ